MLREFLSKIADQFRTYLDTTEPINAQDFAGKVEDVAVRYNQLGFTNGYNLGLEEGKPLGKLELLQNSEYMNAKVSGTAISVNDVSPIEHSVGCKVASKNLFDVSNYKIPPYETTGGFDISSLKIGETYIFSSAKPIVTFKISSTEYGYNSVQLTDHNGFTSYTFTMQKNENISEEQLLFISDISGNWVTEPSLLEDYNIQIEKSTTATSYAPYIADLSNVEVSRYGKNLFDIDTVLPSFINNYGNAGKWIKQSDGSYFKNNVGTGHGDIWFENKANYKGQIAISMASKHTITEVGGLGLTLEVAYTDGTQETAIYTPMLSETYSVKTFVTDANKTVFRITQSYNSGKGMYVKDVMIAYGSDTTYEPYIEPTTYQSTADGTVKGVTSISPNMTFLTNNNGVVINANYLRDIDTYIDNLITNVALTGGE